MNYRPTVKVAFLDFFTSDAQTNLSILFETIDISNHFKFQIKFAGEPDLVFFGDFGRTHEIKFRNIPRIYWKSEASVFHHQQYYDHCFGYCQNDDKHTYFIDHAKTPQCQQWLENTLPKATKTWIEQPKNKFCNFVYSARHTQTYVREQFCRKLMKYRRVDCPGRVLNNMPKFDDRHGENWNDNKLKILSNYKFTIAFENQSLNGYVTEKFFHPLKVKSIPIYWGDPQIGEKFNAKAFINCHEYSSFDAVIKHVIEVDNNDKLYQNYLSESPFLPNQFPPIGLDKQVLENRLATIIHKLTSSQFQISKRPLPIRYFLRYPISLYSKVERRVKIQYHNLNKL